MDNGALQATGILNIIVQTLNAEQAKQALNNINQRLQNVNRTASKMGPSFRRGIIGVFYMRQALKTVTNAVKEFGAGNDLLAEKLDTVGSTVSDATLGYMVMSNAIKGSLGSWVGLALAVARVTATIITWRKHMMEAAAGVISKYSTVNNTLKKIAEATSDLEALSNYMKLVKNFGEEGANALLKMGEVDFETLVRNSDVLQKNLLEVLKNSKLGRKILQETATTQKIAITDTIAGLEDQVEIIKYNVIPAWRQFKRELGLGEFGTIIANIQSLNKGLDDFYTKLYGYRAPTPKGVGTEEWEKEQEKLEDIKQFLEEKREAEQKFYQELLKLRGQDFEAFKLDLENRIREYSKYIDNKELLDEYRRLSIEQYLKEIEEKEKAARKRIIEADISAIREFNRLREQEEEEWHNLWVQLTGSEEEQLLNSLEQQLKGFSHLYLTADEKAKFFYENIKKYAEDSFGSQMDMIAEMRDILGISPKSNLEALMEEVQGFQTRIDNIRSAYTTLLQLDLSPLQQKILDIMQQHDEWIEKTGDINLATEITNKQLLSLYDEERRAVEEKNQAIIDDEQMLRERIKELTLDEYHFRLEQLDRQAEAYRQEGLSEKTIAEWLYREKLDLWEREIEAFREKERRKQEIQENAFYRYRQFILKAQGLEERARLESELRNIKDLISQIWSAYGEADPEKAKSMIDNVIGFLPDYLKNVFGEAETEMEDFSKKFRDWATGSGEYAKYKKIYYKPEWGRQSPWSYLEDVPMPERKKKELFPWLEWIEEAQKELGDFFESLKNPPEIQLPPELEKPIEPDYSKLSDDIKTVTLSQQDFWKEVVKTQQEYQNLKNRVSEFADAYKRELIKRITEAEQGIRISISNLINQLYALATTRVGGIPSFSWYETGLHSGEAYAKGFREGIESIGDSIAEPIAQRLRFRSPPEKGPLSDADKYGLRFIRMFIESMQQGAGYLESGIQSIFAPVTPNHLLRNLLKRQVENITPALEDWSLERIDRTYRRLSLNYPAELLRLSGQWRKRRWFAQKEKEWENFGPVWKEEGSFNLFYKLYKALTEGVPSWSAAERHIAGRYTPQEVLEKAAGHEGEGWKSAIALLLKAKKEQLLTNERFNELVKYVFELVRKRGGVIDETERTIIESFRAKGSKNLGWYISRYGRNYSPDMLAWMLQYYGGESGLRQSMPDFWSQLLSSSYSVVQSEDLTPTTYYYAPQVPQTTSAVAGSTSTKTAWGGYQTSGLNSFVITFNLFTDKNIEINELKEQITQSILNTLYRLGYS